MRYFLRKGSLLLLLTACLLVMGACDLFLGPQVNTGIPSVNKGDDEMFLQGTYNKRYLDVTQSQGFGIDRVYMEIPYYDRDTGAAKTKTIEAEYDGSVNKWFVIIDVSDMEDGQIKTHAIAKDVSGNIGDNKELIYIVKNLPPQIQMTIPSIRGNEFDDEIFMDGLVANDPVFVGFDLMGLATDNYGIPLGWPKIMIWPSGDPVDASGVPTNPKWKVWRSMEVPAARDGLTTTRITWPMLQLIPDAVAEGGYRLPKPGEPRAYLSNGHYRFRIWTKDLFGNDNYYPNRTDNTLGLDPDDPAYPIKYIEIDYMVSEIPIARVNEIRRYYNGVGGFTAKVVVTSTNPLEKVEVFIADTDSGMSNASARLEIPVSSRLEEKPGDDLYNPSSTTYTYDLSFTDVEMISRFTPWPSPIGNGDLYFHVVAEDVSHKTSPMASREFTYDIAAPTVKFRRPFNIESITPPAGFSGSYTESGTHYEIYRPSDSPKWVTGTVTVEGWSEDPTNGIPSSGIAKVYYHIGNLFDDTTGQNHAGRQTIYENPVNWTDTKLDDPFTHADGWSGNLGTWSYTAYFNRYKLDFPSLVQNAADFNFADSLGVDDVTIDVTGTVNRQRFYLPFYVKVVDRAGNIKIIHYKLAIDPDMDIPVVDINYPKEFDPIDGPVGGEVRLSGIATDNEWVHTVLIRIHRADRPAGTYYIPTSYYGGTQFYGSGRDVGFPKPRNAANTADDTAGWFEAYKIGNDMVVGWYYNINGDNGLDPDAGFQTVDVTIEVRAIDSKDGVTTTGSLIGPAEVVHVKFSAGVPTISIPVISGGVGDRDYVDGIRTSGTMKVTTILREDHNAAIGSVKIRFNGAGSPWTEIIGNNNAINYANCSAVGATITGPFNDGLDAARQTCFKLELNINTLTYASYGSTNTLKIDLTAADNSTPPLSVSGSYTFEIDNYYPTAVITTQPIASGTGFVISGEAKDYNRDNMIQGLERMLVYFEEAEIRYNTSYPPSDPRYRTVVGTKVFRNPRNRPIGYFNDTFSGTYGSISYAGPPYTLPVNNITWGTSGIPTMVTYPKVMDTTLSSWNESVTTPNATDFENFPVLKLVNKSSIPAVGGNVWESPHAMVIDSQEFGETTDSDQDGTRGEVWDGMVDKQWQARMNTTLFPDGPLMVHYIVMDQAGNATHYQKPIYIENKKPKILSVNMGTDINKDSIVDPYVDSEHPGEFRSAITIVGHDQAPNSIIQFTPAFRVRNNRLEFSINTEPGTGNNGKRYRVAYVERGASIDAKDMKTGSVYTVNDTGSTEWLKYGAPVSAAGVTFVASGPGEGNGTVFPYTEVAGTAVPGSFAGDSAVIPITSFVSIPDSSKAGGVITTPNDRLFIIKVYDNTVQQVKVDGSPTSTVPESDQLAHAILVAMNIDNTDTLPPTISAAPFGQKYVLRTTGGGYPTLANDADKVLGSVNSYNENIVMAGNVKQGYVQYGSTTDISGKVVFLGKAEDNQRIQNITVQIPGYNGGAGLNNAFTVAEWSGGSLVSNRSSMGTGTSAWYFNIIHNELSLDYGHAIDWEFGWDSSEVANQVGSPTVTFRVNDFRAAGSPASSTQAVNIAPYISDVVTRLSGAYSVMPSAFNRSANGWYPVRESEVITIKGFNLGTDSTTTEVRLGGTSLTTPNGTVLATPSISKTEIQANIGTTANSGELVVWVGPGASRVASINNKNNNTAVYNQEPNNVNNNTLTDDRRLYVWNVGYLYNNSVIDNPFMRLSSDANRYLTYGYYVAPASGTSGRYVVRINDGETAIESSYNRYLNATIAIDQAKSWYAASSNMSANGVPGLTFFARTTATGASGATGNNKRPLLEIGSDANRFKIPRVFAYNTNGTTVGTNTNMTRIFMSYADTLYSTKPVLFRYGLVGVNNTFGGNFNNNQALTNNNPPRTDGNYTGGSTNNIVSAQVIADNTTKYRSSIYSAVGGLQNGRALVAWFGLDSTDGTEKLFFSYGSAAPGNNTTHVATNTYGGGTPMAPAANTWQGNARPIPGSAGKGSHVDMAVDEDENVHLAFYDAANGGLYYSLIPSGSVVSTSTTGIKAVKVDTFLAVGTKIMINVRNENGKKVPYISYFHNSFAGTQNSIRVAWRKDFTDGTTNVPSGTNDLDFFTGDWEVMTVPVLSVPKSDEFICNGVPANTGTAWATGSNLTSRNLDKTILLGYMAADWYEGAVLKHTLWESL